MKFTTLIALIGATYATESQEEIDFTALAQDQDQAQELPQADDDDHDDSGDEDQSDDEDDEDDDDDSEGSEESASDEDEHGDAQEEKIDLAQDAGANGSCEVIPAQPEWVLKPRGKHSGCGNRRKRGRGKDVGKHLSLEQCIQKCEEAGPKVCNNIEHGGKYIGHNCRLWSGDCQVGGRRQRRVDSNVYERAPKVVQDTNWTLRWKHSGCNRPDRGAYKDLGHNLSLDECQARCDKAGPKVCNQIEFGRSYIRGACRAWTGECGLAKWVNSDIYVRTDAPIQVNEIGECPKGATTCFTATDGVRYA